MVAVKNLREKGEESREDTIENDRGYLLALTGCCDVGGPKSGRG